MTKAKSIRAMLTSSRRSPPRNAPSSGGSSQQTQTSVTLPRTLVSSANGSSTSTARNDERQGREADSHTGEAESNFDVSIGSYSHYQEMEIKVPGPFVVLQGNAGDGLSNTVDGPLPVLARTRRTRQRVQAAAAAATATQTQSPEEEEEFQHVSTNAAAGIVNGPRFAVTVGAVAAAAAVDAGVQSSASSDEYVVVVDDANTNGTPTNHLEEEQQEQQQHEDQVAIANWESSRRQSELQQKRDWEDSLYQVPPAIIAEHVMMNQSPVTHVSNDPESRSWWQRNGEVAVLRELPTKLFDGSVTVSRIGTLPPGSTVMAMDLIELNSGTLLPIEGLKPTRQGIQDHNGASSSSSLTSPTSHRERTFSQGRIGIIQMIKLETKEGRTGYTCLSLDGYPLLGPGLPNAYVDPASSTRDRDQHTPGGPSRASESWIWRVTCPSGAFVREGLDLHTRHIETLPYGSLVRVTRRCINNQGLSRLRTSGYLSLKTHEGNSRVLVTGWCSELLNPLSGQRGIVAQPLPFPVPAIYRVTLPMGAVVRRDIELMSPQIEILPFGSTIKVVARAFSEHPVERCIERLQLAGGGGWISVRLNLPPPQDDLVVELVDIDSDFDPENPGLYHLNAQRAVRAERERERAEHNPSDLSSVDENEISDDSANHEEENCNIDGTQQHSAKCVVCLTSERNATIVHGETGHVVCCLVCARILKARGDKCPVCRLDIDLVIQHFYA